MLLYVFDREGCSTSLKASGRKGEERAVAVVADAGWWFYKNKKKHLKTKNDVKLQLRMWTEMIMSFPVASTDRLDKKTACSFSSQL